MTPFAYQLAEDAYVCLADEVLVFSNIRDDKYSCLNRQNTRVALRVFPDFQERCTSLLTECTEVDPQHADQVMRALVDGGLLADRTERGKSITPVRIPEPTKSLLSKSAASNGKHHVLYFASFLRACLTASTKLRLQSLRRTVRGIENRKRRHSKSAARCRNELDDLVGVFRRLRPYYAREYICRFDSLALIEFLAHYHHYPSWVFGVRSEPFGAHCWVQEGDCVLNDTTEYLTQFTPIMAF